MAVLRQETGAGELDGRRRPLSGMIGVSASCLTESITNALSISFGGGLYAARSQDSESHRLTAKEGS